MFKMERWQKFFSDFEEDFFCLIRERQKVFFSSGRTGSKCQKTLKIMENFNHNNR